MIAISSLSLFFNLGLLPPVAQANTQPVTVSIDGALIPTFSELVAQAEALAVMAIAQHFQSDPDLMEVQVIVLAEREGQVVSILSSQLTRETWQTSTNLRPWIRYFTTASVLLGYTAPSPVAQQRPLAPASLISAISTNDVDPRETVSEAMRTGRISDSEYWELMDALD